MNTKFITLKIVDWIVILVVVIGFLLLNTR